MSKRTNMVNEIIANFDFEKVQNVMTHLEWGWHGEGVPSLSRLKEGAIERLDSAIDGLLSSDINHNIAWISSSGGFKATAWKNKKGKLKKLSLEFIITDWDTD